MNILALETTAAACSVALVDDERGPIERFEPMVRGHAERLMPMINEVLAEAGTSFAALDLIAAATGPGTFTGLRVGLAAARGIALAAGRPCLGVTAFAAVLEAERGAAERAWKDGRAVLVVLDSRRSELFAQCFLPPDGASQEPVVATAERLAGVAIGSTGLVLGTAAAIVGEAMVCLDRDGSRTGPSITSCAPRASAVARVALRRWQRGERPGRPCDPVYLRAPDTGGGSPRP